MDNKVKKTWSIPTIMDLDVKDGTAKSFNASETLANNSFGPPGGAS